MRQWPHASAVRAFLSPRSLLYALSLQLILINPSSERFKQKLLQTGGPHGHSMDYGDAQMGWPSGGMQGMGFTGEDLAWYAAGDSSNGNTPLKASGSKKKEKEVKEVSPFLYVLINAAVSQFQG